MKKYIAFCVIFSGIFTNYVQSQVTIGAAIPPKKGALLDLSPYDVMTKGLGLPRVELSDINRLIIGGKLVSPEADSESERTSHTGLLVYNVNEDICADQSIYEALYVWDGEKWQGLNIEDQSKLAPTVELLVDDRDPNNVETYLTGLFGNKRWMLENIRAKIWDPKRDNAKEKNQKMKTLIGPYITKKGTAAWVYPKEANSKNGTDRETNDNTWFKNRPELGLLYNHNAASHYKYEDCHKSGTNYPQEGGKLKTEKDQYTQGICPSGWHLPTDKEWTDLELELIRNTPKYSYAQKPIAKSPNDTDGLTYGNDESQRMQPQKDANGEYGRGSSHGHVMRGRCENKEGLSRGAIKNGFVLTLAGHVYAAQKGLENFHGINGYAFLWTSSHDKRTFWARGLYDGASTLIRSSFPEDYMFSVRCVKND